MALKHFQVFSLTFLVSLLFSPIGHANGNTPSDKISSPFHFIKQLKGSRKGNNIEGIYQLKAYLKEFGYLDQTHVNDDDFDDTLESAIKTYQENYHIKPTGTLDAVTISKMTSPRCGVPDIINGTNYMQHHKIKHDSSSSDIHMVSHYTFFSGNLKWPSSKTLLTYNFLSNVPTFAIAPVARAFQKWASATHFSFARAQDNQNADLTIGFYRGDHGDGTPFNGTGGTLAHAFPPTDGRFHYDADEPWSDGAVANTFDLETIALHEIGHLLGLNHSSVQEAIMYPTFSPAEIKNLHPDDIQGIKVLYNR
ncbi:hypothetical protein C2S51_034771 [Perilla frutescens var. frutescens]|nr:hypothetical protein C2S51_034771 [Perilla frutescens var. frutescens]